MDIEKHLLVQGWPNSGTSYLPLQKSRIRVLLKPRNRKVVLAVFVAIVAIICQRFLVKIEVLDEVLAKGQLQLNDLVNLSVAADWYSTVVTTLDWNSNATIPSEDYATADAPSEEGPDDFEDADRELDDFQISWGELSNYPPVTKLGEGVYSEVFYVKDVRNDKGCVAKKLHLVAKRRVKREIKILQELSGGPNIIKLIDVVKEESGQPWIMMEFVNNTHYRTLYPTLTDLDIRFYMFQLLRAIEHAHNHNIMHRDIKPHNIMIDHAERKLRLIDWGLSDYYDEKFTYTTNVASRFWRAPELLIGYEWYNLSVDMWSFGCMLAALIFQKEPFFRGRHDDVNQLVKISKVLGTDDLFQWINKYEIDAELTESFAGNLTGSYEKKRWGSFVPRSARDTLPLVNDEALELLDKILVYDHNARLTAAEALAHPYFDTIREEAMNQTNTVTTWNV